jgi:hypothetical protein
VDECHESGCRHDRGHSGDPSKTGTATIQVATTGTVAITPASANLVVNQTLSLQASADTLNDCTWVIYPTGAGSIATDDNDSSRVVRPDRAGRRHTFRARSSSRS